MTIDTLTFPAGTPLELLKEAQHDPILAQDLRNPFIPPDVFDYMDCELKKLGIPWNKIWFCEPLTQEIAEQFIEDLGKEWSRR